MYLYFKWFSVGLLTCCALIQATEKEEREAHLDAKENSSKYFTAKDRDSCIFQALNHALKVLNIGSHYKLESKFKYRWAILNTQKFWVNLVDTKTGAATPYSLNARVSIDSGSPHSKTDYVCHLDTINNPAMAAYIYDKNKDATIVSANERPAKLKILDAREYAKLRPQIYSDEFPPHAFAGARDNQSHSN